MGVDLVVAIGVRSVGGVAEAGGVAQEVFVERPEAAGPHEGLVVEAGGDERSGETEGGHEVEVQAGPGVDVADFEPGRGGGDGGQPVGEGAGAVAELDEGVGVFGAGGDDAAGAVVLEAAADEGDAVGEEGGGDGVAAEGTDGASVKGELEGRVAVDAAAVVETKGLAH